MLAVLIWVRYLYLFLINNDFFFSQMLTVVLVTIGNVDYKWYLSFQMKIIIINFCDD
jgi:hypothetical protein